MNDYEPSEGFFAVFISIAGVMFAVCIIMMVYALNKLKHGPVVPDPEPMGYFLIGFVCAVILLALPVGGLAIYHAFGGRKNP